ncbi:hypothetical protein ACFQRC_04400 [Enterovirga sp. GCM10030262]|uniref:hypothetical protein n=1 Tax=Enterovirga sp. GCM10030262 TaxID=3273391 RepID=UPI003618603C
MTDDNRLHRVFPEVTLSSGLRGELLHRKPTRMQLTLIRHLAYGLQLPMPQPESAEDAYVWFRNVTERHSDQIRRLYGIMSDV